MAEKESRDGLTKRSSCRKSLAELSLPREYLEQLEEKRKQLDDSIHKYIAAKERDYKQFEKELRNQHRIAQGQDAINGAVKRRPSSESSQGDDQTASLEAQSISAVDALMVTSKRGSSNPVPETVDHVSKRREDRSSMAGLKDRRASLERDKEFVGLFTPPYLSMLDDRDARTLERPSSAPSAVLLTKNSDAELDVATPERANSNTAAQAKPKRPSRLALAQRNSSSGSSADGKLASAMKSPSQQSKRKRVSLAVGDSIVAPWDSVPVTLGRNSTPSHSRMRSVVSQKGVPNLTEEEPRPIEDESPRSESLLQTVQQATFTSAPEEENSKSCQDPASTSPQSSSPRNIGSPRTTPAATKIDPDGDLFDLEAEEDLPPEEEIDELESALESDDNDITGRIEGNEVLNDSAPDTDEVRYDSTAGLVPEPRDGTDNAATYLAFGPSSAVASQQPIRPGFRRPSVVNDPVLRGPGYKAEEKDAAENEVYGSSFNRPTSKGSFTAGSLGESYMAAHAEEMMKHRGARQQTQVKS
ncbi:hypothetical protein LTR37_002699 [Vermiconidia calcicola]|uniref:Uncharacterized protein n=1 Tax=Vermiconidia calcicola TaxID=1690605 RepID=A0ACC3NVA4_9PEZI|nr:hypothetical protein LTR37_002699 [Vermiconidia calcicola]